MRLGPVLMFHLRVCGLDEQVTLILRELYSNRRAVKCPAFLIPWPLAWPASGRRRFLRPAGRIVRAHGAVLGRDVAEAAFLSAG